MKKALLLFLLLPFFGFGKNTTGYISKNIKRDAFFTSSATAISDRIAGAVDNINGFTKSLKETFACTYTVSSVSTTDACSVGKQSTVTVTSTAAGMPAGSYTVEYRLSYNGYSTVYTAAMTVTTSGSVSTGTFTSDLSILSATQTTSIKIYKLTLSGCTSDITANNNSNTLYMAVSKGAPTANSGYASCNDWVAQWNNDSVDGYYLDVATNNTFTTYVSGYQNLYIAGYPSGYTLTGLSHGGTYYYRVRSKNYCGTSANSNIVSFTEKGNGSSNPGTIGGGASSICVGASTTFTNSGSNPTNGTWSIFNQSGAATITNAGTVTGTAPGTVTVVYTVGSGCVSSQTQSLTITGGTIGNASSTPTLCINTPLTAITHATSGFTGIGTPSNLPAGVTASWASNTVTVSGTPTASGTFNYSIPLTGGTCGTANATGTIIVTPANTITLTSATGTNAQALCVNNAINSITYDTTGATGVSFTGLPTGLVTNFASNKITISGTPTAANSSPYTYTVTLTGGCSTVTATGTIRVNPSNTITLNPTGTNTQTVCINSPITSITYDTTGATGATFSGLPTGLTTSFASNKVTISGSPTSSSATPYNYTVTLTGGCGTVTATGTITVNPVNTITLTSATGTNAQTLCLGAAITDITYDTTRATGVTFSGLPTGLTTSFASNKVTISGTPTAVNASPYTYTVTLTGGCGTVTATGTIRVNPILTASVALTTDQSSSTICQNTNVRFTATPTNGGTTPTYQWYNGTTLLTETSNSYLLYNVTSTDAIKVVMTSNATPCLTGSPTTSSTISFSIITTDRGRTHGGGSICYGSIPNKMTLTNFDNPNQDAAYSYPEKVLRWEYSDDNNVTWTPIAGTANLIEYQPTTPLYAKRAYRAVAQTSGCPQGFAAIETSFSINPVPTVTFTAEPGASACLGANVVYTTQASQYNYAWTYTGINNTDYKIISGGSTTSNTVTLQWLTTGSKTVTVNYKNGNTGNSCAATTATSSTPTTISALPATPTITAGGPTTFCSGGSVTLTSSTGTTYLWSNGETTQSITVTTAGTYSVKITNAAGCQSASSANTVTTLNALPATPTITAGGPTTFCSGASVTLTSSAGTTYLWSNGATTQSITVSMGGTFSVKVTNASTCQSSSSTDTTVTVNALPATPTITAGGPTTFCSGGSVTLTSSAGTTYLWSNGATTQSISVTTSGTYSVKVTNASTCQSASSTDTTVTVNTAPTAPAASVTVQPTCSNNTGTIEFTSLGSGYTYSVDGSTFLSTTTFSGLTAASYYVKVKNSSGCESPTTLIQVNTPVSKKWNGSVSTDWNTAANWTPSGVPTASDCVQIPNVTTKPVISPANNNYYAYTLTVDTNGSLTVGSTNTLTVTDVVNVSGTGSLIFENTASLVQKNNVANTGNITYKRDITARRYDATYWSSPVTAASGFTMHNLSPDTLLDKYYTWNPLTGWVVNLNGTSVMTPGQGYNIRAPQPFDTVTAATFTGVFTGVPNNGDITFTPEPASWNFIGNPYPSALDAKKLMAANPNLGTLYFWTHNSSPSSANAGNAQYNYTSADYAVFNYTGGTASSTGGAIPTGYIGAGQSFFAKVSTADPIVITNAMRLSGNNQQFYKTDKTDETNVNRVWLNFTSTQGAYKQVLIGYLDGATNNWDMNYDAPTMNGNAYVDFYSINDSRKLTIQGRALPFDNTETLPLGYKTTVAGDYIVAIDHVDGLFANQAVYLEDKVTGKITDLTTSNYTFTSAVGTFAERLVLRYTNKTLGTGDFDDLESTILISVKDKAIKLTSSKESIKNVVIYDINGKLLYDNNKIDSTELQISNLQSSNQVLLVKVTLDNDFTTTKKIIFQ